MNKINHLLESLVEEQNQTQITEMIDKLKQHIFRLGEFHKHYNRKEKLFFPIMERYGHYASTRTVWKADIRIRALYLAVKKQFVPQDVNLTHVRKRYGAFEKEFNEMIVQEEAIILPILQSIFYEADWLAFANESDAFGYALIEAPEEKWMPKSNIAANDKPKTQNLVLGGGGYLTTEEAKLILNNLPLEITFVDKNDMFKYFNEITEASDMMLVRTPFQSGAT